MILQNLFLFAHAVTEDLGGFHEVVPVQLLGNHVRHLLLVGEADRATARMTVRHRPFCFPQKFALFLVKTGHTDYDPLEVLEPSVREVLVVQFGDVSVLKFGLEV